MLHFEELDAALAAAGHMQAEPLFMFAGMPAAIAPQPPGDASAGTEHPAQFGLADFRCWDEYVNRVVEHLMESGTARSWSSTTRGESSCSEPCHQTSTHNRSNMRRVNSPPRRSL